MKRYLARDFIVYIVSSFQGLLLKGKLVCFIRDVISFSQWRKFHVSSHDILDHRVPWMNFEVISFLGDWLMEEMHVYEYGSGGSTLFISSRVKQVHSIEHNAEWFNKVKSVIKKEEIKNVDYRLFSPFFDLHNAGKKCDNPLYYLSCMEEFKSFNFENYVRSIDQFPDFYFDLVIVDGRARPSCIKHAIPKIKKGGVLLVDNADREYYLQPFPELNDRLKWKQQIFTGHTPFGLTSVLYTTKLFTKK